MDENRPIITKNGIGLGTIAFITWLVFFILKLTGIINWHWVFVFLPLIIWGGLFVLVIVFLLIILLLCTILNNLK